MTKRLCINQKKDENNINDLFGKLIIPIPIGLPIVIAKNNSKERIIVRRIRLRVKAWGQ